MIDLHRFLKMAGVVYNIERNEININSQTGLPNHEESTGKAYIGFLPDTDICINDWLINPAGEKFFVVNKETKYFQGKPFQLAAYIITETEYINNANTHNQQATFNIHEVHNSIVGTQSNPTISNGLSINDLTKLIESRNSNDKEKLKEMIALIEQTVNNQSTINKRLLSRFSDVLKRNDWISAPLATFILEKFFL